MAKRIIWSARAQRDRKAIFRYWNKRNKSKIYSRKLNTLFKETILLIAKYPYLGKAIEETEVRAKVVKDYLIIYEFDEDTIFILTIWDSRQNPDSLTVLLKN